MSYANELIATCLAAQGMDEEQAKRVAETVLKVTVAAGLIARANLEVWEREAAIYTLRCRNTQVLALSQRFGITKRQVFMSIRRAMERRRAAFSALAS